MSPVAVIGLVTVAVPCATPVTVTVCSSAQLLAVKVSGPETVAVLVFPEAGVMVTVPPGGLFRRTW